MVDFLVGTGKTAEIIVKLKLAEMAECYIPPIQVRVGVDIPRNIYILPSLGWVV